MRRALIRLIAVGLVVLVGVLAVPAASAAPICAAAILTAPGSTVLMANGAFGDCTGIAASSTLLASLSVPFTSSAGFDSGTLVSAVFRENVAGTLDFYYQVALNRTSTNCGHDGQPACDPVARETDINFNNGGAWTTWVATRGDAVGPFAAGTVFPVTADRSPLGDVMGFSFNPPDTFKLMPGQTSAILIVSTNAMNFTLGNSSVVDGGVTTVASFEPDAGPSIPEPASLCLVGSGLIGIRLVRRSRRS